VEVDGDYVRFLGRDGDMINVGGQKVFPAEIEDLLLDLDLIAEASVYGEPNPLLGSAVVCKVRPVRPDIGAAELRGAIRRHLSGKVEPYKIPQKVVVTQDVLATDRFKQIRR
jgi:long-chain acyl-CoA synthetase